MKPKAATLKPTQAILVCQGAEHAAVCRGLQSINSQVAVLPMPVGPAAVARSLSTLLQQGDLPGTEILVVGLCGSLSERCQVGDVMIYRKCALLTDAAELYWLECDRALTERLQQRLGQARLVNGLTSDRMIHTAAEKRQLGQTYTAEVVDMEGFAILETLKSAHVSVAMMRVVSDDCQYDLPDLTATLDANGSLRPLPMAIAFMQQPLAAIHLIRGSLQALKQLQQIVPAILG